MVRESLLTPSLLIPTVSVSGPVELLLTPRLTVCLVDGVGYGVENAEDNLAGNVATVKAAVPATRAVRRQLHGEGVAADALFTDTDSKFI